MDSRYILKISRYALIVCYVFLSGCFFGGGPSTTVPRGMAPGMAEAIPTDVGAGSSLARYRPCDVEGGD